MRAAALFFGLLFAFMLEATAQADVPPCGSESMHVLAMGTNPEYAQAFETLQEHLSGSNRSLPSEQDVYTIPVVVHVVHRGSPIGVQENISDAQILSAIDGMNDDFRNRVSDSEGADTFIQFEMARRTPAGEPTNGIIRVNGNSVPGYAEHGISNGQDDDAADQTAVKSLTTWFGDDYINIFVVPEINGNDGGNGVQGFAYLGPTNDARDGIVVIYNAFGLVGELKPGRTLNKTITHEMGHHLSLYHTFSNTTSCTSETNCETEGDLVCDTPATISNTSGCISPTCEGAQVENYMDYAQETCKNMFSAGQRDRMRACLESSRSSLLESLGGMAVTDRDLTIAGLGNVGESTCLPSLTPSVIVTNFGTQTVTGFELTASVNEHTPFTTVHEESVSSGASIEVMLPELALAADTLELHLEVRLLGNVQDDFAGNDQSVQHIVLAQSDFWTMTLNTDLWANEISWRIEDSEGEAIMSGGDYPINVATYESSGCVPVGCYTLIMEDTNGDGLCSFDFGNDGTCDIGGSMSLTNAAGDVLVELDNTNNNYGYMGSWEVCASEATEMEGCDDLNSNGICDAAELSGCQDVTACNFTPGAIFDDGTCQYLDIVGACGGSCQTDLNNNDICDASEASIYVELDTSFFGANTPFPGDDFDMTGLLEGYSSFIVYAEFSDEADVLSAIFSDTASLPQSVSMGIEAPCGCFNPLDNDLVLNTTNTTFLWDFLPMNEYDTFWTIGMLSGDATFDGIPGTIPSKVGDTNGNEAGSNICNSQLTNGTIFITGSEGYWPSNAVAGEDLKVEIARVTTCGSFSISGGIQSFLSGSQNNVSLTYFDVTVIPGCTDFDACNYDAGATVDDSFCDYSCYGCTDSMACNYDEEATIDDEECTYMEEFFDCEGNCISDSDGDGVCDQLEVLGCTALVAENYDPQATDDDGSCTFSLEGCMDPEACNYNPIANTDVGGCIYAETHYDCNGNCLNDTDGDGICDGVTFNVNMACAPSDFDNVFVTGPWCGWCANDSFNTMTDDNGDGVYSVTIPDLFGEVEYKYAINGFAGQENLVNDMINGSECAPITDFAGYANRAILANNGVVVYDYYGTCDGECNDAIPGPPSVVTFHVDMAGYESSFNTVNLNGSFNGWCGTCTPMTDEDGDGVFSCDAVLNDGAIEYKFTVDGWTDFEMLEVGTACTVSIDGYTNRTLDVSGDENLPVVCWNKCNACEHEGCTDFDACNYDASANIDDGFCDYSCYGCTEPSALNFDETATDPDGSCAWVGVNCEVSENVFDIVEGLSILPFEPSEVIYGVDTAVNLVVVLPPVVSEPGTGSLFNAVSFAVDTIDGLPPGMDTESLPGTIPAEETACLVLAGVPQQEGWFDVSIEGHLTVSFFGQHLTLSGVSISHAVFVSENPNPIAGCTYGLAVNYLSYANLDDGSCLIAGCTNPEACNHQPLASLDDGTCNYECWGCTYDSASNFDTAATRDDGSCAFGPSPFNCNEDLNNDGNVGSSDLLDLLAGFGSPCGAP